MVLGTGHIRSNLWLLWEARHWPVRLKVESQGTTVLLMAARPRGSVCRQLPLQLGPGTICLHFPTFCYIAQSSPKNSVGGGRRYHNCTSLAHKTLVFPVGAVTCTRTAQYSGDWTGVIYSWQEEDPPHDGPNGAASMPLLQRSLQAQGLSAAAAGTISKARRESTKRLYDTYLEKWTAYCGQRDIDPVHPGVVGAINFLQSLMDEPNTTRGYSAVATARSALSSVVVLESGIPFGEHPLVKTFMTGVHNLRPISPRYTTIWSIDIVLKLLKTWSPAKKTLFGTISQKIMYPHFVSF